MLEYLTCPSHRFSELHHQAPYKFVRPQILISRDVSDCEILCYDPLSFLWWFFFSQVVSLP
jgi:hypothetical protein